ncbi:lysozyme g-like isoform X3 [Entelurus aequoreus]|uniref:lysozyme g-like isoform X3 n=1 Tax=Entelurus aequoreus TaxID=161455 RepID=UPI002B1D2AD6|nr:lysozyme g-like isoform X3 [Entelurus aequoreus]
MSYGDIMRAATTGAGPSTSGQDKLSVTGVAASHTMAQTDLSRMNQYKSIIIEVGNEKGIAPALIAGIISRESRAGNTLNNGWGDKNNGWGLMQVDRGSHIPQGEWNSKEHLCQGTDILIDFIKAIRRKFPDWTAEQQLKGGIAAYNFGAKNVQTLAGMDLGTLGDDYSSDVVARSQWYKTNGCF